MPINSQNKCLWCRVIALSVLSSSPVSFDFSNDGNNKKSEDNLLNTRSNPLHLHDWFDCCPWKVFSIVHISFNSNFTAHSSADSISPESSAIQKLTGIHESLERAGDKMEQLVGNSTESERGMGELHERRKRNAIQ